MNKRYVKQRKCSVKPTTPQPQYQLSVVPLRFKSVFLFGMLLSALIQLPMGDIASAQTFSDGFEEPTINPFWTLTSAQFGSVSLAPGQSHSGSQSIRFSSANGGDRFIYLTHQFPSVRHGRVSIWFYDSAPGQETLYSHLNVFNSTIPGGQSGHSFYVGIDDWEPNVYRVYGPGLTDNIASPVRRSVGWHLFEIRTSPNGGEMLVDGIRAYSFAGNFGFDIVQLTLQGPSWRPNATYYFDDFSLISECPVGPLMTAEVSCPSPVNESLLDQRLQESLAEFKSRITSKNGSYSISCGWRPIAVQEHFYEIKTKFNELRERLDGVEAYIDRSTGKARPQLRMTQTNAACRQILDEVNAEIMRHLLKPAADGSPAVAKPGTGAHERGQAVDMNVYLPAGCNCTIDQLALSSGLYRPDRINDDIHFEMIGVNPPRRLRFAGRSPINLLVTDPQGRRVGFEPISNSAINEIGEFAAYSGPGSTPQRIEILPNQTLSGEYQIAGVGTGSGSYSITVEISDEEGSAVFVEKLLASGVANTGEPLAPIAPIDCVLSSMRLDFDHLGEDLLLLAPPWATNAVLECSSNLATGSWNEYSQPIDRANGLVITNAANQAKFFRLRNP